MILGLFSFACGIGASWLAAYIFCDAAENEDLRLGLWLAGFEFVCATGLLTIGLMRLGGVL